MFFVGMFLRARGVQAAGASLITLALALRVVDHLRSGRAYARGRYYSRELEPGWYWRIVVTFMAAIGIVIWFISTLLRAKPLGP